MNITLRIGETVIPLVVIQGSTAEQVIPMEEVSDKLMIYGQQ